MSRRITCSKNRVEELETSAKLLTATQSPPMQSDRFVCLRIVLSNVDGCETEPIYIPVRWVLHRGERVRRVDHR